MDDFQNIYKCYTDCKSTAATYKPLWDDISKFVGIQVRPDYIWNNNQVKSQQLDEYVDDPTASISVNQFGDYLTGIMWATGDKVVDIVPSRYVLELVDEEVVKPYYNFATDQLLYHMNHVDAGYSTALRSYAYDQAAFGTSGIGLFENKDFRNGIADNALITRTFGIDNSVCDEGKSGVIEIIFAPYHWKVNRIVGEFCTEDGQISDKLVAKLPKPIRDAYNKGNYNDEFTIIFGVFPRKDYSPKLKGKRGTRYRGVWFMETNTSKDNAIFFEEDFEERPISIARMIKIRGDIYGRSSGTMLISTIRSVNFMISETIEIIEKMGNPALGIWNNAIFGDSVLDSSPDGLTVFNQALAGGADKPTFPLYDVGDPSGIIKFLVPYLNEKIVTAFKIDALLDFSSAKQMTATESLQRYAIRGKSLSGMLLQQKNERLTPDVRRAISILRNVGELGADPRTQEALVKKLKANKRDNRIIPQEVVQVMESGRPWYELRWNNELEKLTRTETVQALVQVIQSITAIAALFPNIIEAVDWYKLLQDINNNLDANNQILYSAKEFKAKVEEIAKQRAAAMAMQVGQAGSEIQKNSAQANKNNQEAKAVQNA
jgi:hypothetical protein